MSDFRGERNAVRNTEYDEVRRNNLITGLYQRCIKIGWMKFSLTWTFPSIGKKTFSVALFVRKVARTINSNIAYSAALSTVIARIVVYTLPWLVPSTLRDRVR